MSLDSESTSRRARKGLFVYFAILVPSTIAIESRLLIAGDDIRNHIPLVLCLMWSPAIASLIARIVLREGIADISLRFGGRTGARMVVYAIAYPLVVGALSYGLAWSTGLAHFKTPEVPSFPNVTTPWIALVSLIAIRSTIGIVVAAIAAAGEEFGWRGYMLTRLFTAKVPYPVFVSGVIWWSWHASMVFGGIYAAGSNRLLSAALFLVTILAQAFFFARLRLESGSVWPAVVAHSAWNSIIQGVFDFSTVDVTSTSWVGEAGLLVAMASVIVVAPLVYGPWQKLEAPGRSLEK